MMNLTEYENLLHFMEKAKGTGVTCVLVFKPNLEAGSDDAHGPDYPDLIASTTEDAEVIAAMLGNGGGGEANG